MILLRLKEHREALALEDVKKNPITLKWELLKVMILLRLKEHREALALEDVKKNPITQKIG